VAQDGGNIAGGTGVDASRRWLGGVAWVFLAGCGSTRTGPDAGYEGGASVGTATFTDAATGTVGVTVLVFGSTSVDGGSGWAFTISSTTRIPIYFYCTVPFPGSFVAGSFSGDEEPLSSCGLGSSSVPGRTWEGWEEVTDFRLNITSPGPVFTNNQSTGALIWPYVTGSLTVTLAPYPEYAYGDASVSATFGPPSD
jgi:hypothetical protein